MKKYGGSNQYNGLPLYSFDTPKHNQEQHVKMLISPLSITILKLSEN